MMSEEKKASRKFTVRYATDEDYKRMNFYTIGTLYRADNLTPYQETDGAISCRKDGLVPPLPDSSKPI
jgi:hypothetical protein